MYRALTLLSEYMADIKSIIYCKSKNLTERRDRIIYYDCTNFYFEIEDNDLDIMDQETGEVVEGLRKRGKSKENRPNPIVQMACSWIWTVFLWPSSYFRATARNRRLCNHWRKSFTAGSA